MATPLVPGPAPVWYGFLAEPQFLGWTERGVTIDPSPEWLPYYCDLGGSTPMDYSYQGQSATINFTLSRWNAATLSLLLEDYAGGFPGSAPGVDVAGEIGALMVHEGLALSLWVGFPYVAKVAYQEHMLGYHFHHVIIERESLPERGARPAKVNLTLRAVRRLLMSPAHQNGLLAGTFILYDYDMSAILGRFPD